MKPIKTQWIHSKDEENELDPETVLLCPVCESAPDYCQDHNHYLCQECKEPLELSGDQEFWECWTCPIPYAVAIPLIEEQGVRLTIITAINEVEALRIVDMQPDLGIILTGTKAEDKLTPQNKPKVYELDTFQEIFPEYYTENLN